MAVPLVVPKNADLGEPLRAHEEVPLVSGSGDGEREFVVEGEREANCLTRRKWYGKGDFHDRVIVLIAIVRRDESHALRQVTIALGRDGFDVDGALVSLAQGDIRALLMRFPGKGGLGAESVEVEVKRNGGDRLGRG